MAVLIYKFFLIVHEAKNIKTSWIFFKSGMRKKRIKNILIVICLILVIIVFRDGIQSDDKPPIFFKVIYKDVVLKDELQNLKILIIEEHPPNNLELYLNGTYLTVPLLNRFDNDTILYELIFDPAAISIKEGKLIGDIIAKDKSDNLIKHPMEFFSNIDPFILELIANCSYDPLYERYIGTINEYQLKRISHDACIELAIHLSKHFNITIIKKYLGGL